MYLYRFRIRPERAPDAWRVLEFSAQHTLQDVHDAIQDAFELDGDHLYAFYLSGKHWERDGEVAAEHAAGVRLFRLGVEPGRKFSYVFDFGAELWHELEVIAVRESDAALKEPLLIESVGEAPPQYEGEQGDIEDGDGEDGDGEDGDAEDEQPELDVSELAPLAEELLRLLESDPDPTTDIGRELLRSACPVALELAARLDADEERFWALDETSEGGLLELLFDLPVALAQAGMTREGSDLAVALAFIDPESFRPGRAIVLQDAEAALSQLSAQEVPRQAPLSTRWLSPRVGRNDPCPCGSVKKYKKCCGASA